MDIDKASPNIADASGELKIKGQAEFERRKSKWEAEGDDTVRIVHDQFQFFANFIFCYFVSRTRIEMNL
jgi:hypothetical protein